MALLCGTPAHAATTDLSVWFNSFSPSYTGLYPGGHPTSLGFTLNNNGPDFFGGPASVRIKLILSKNNTYGDADDIPIGTTQIPVSIAANDYESIYLGDPYLLANFTIPSGACGDYYAFMLISIPDSSYYDPNYWNDYNNLPGQITVTPTGPAPTVQSIVRRAPTNQTVSTNTVVWRATFSQAVTGVDTGDFTVTKVNGSISGMSVTKVQASSASVYDVTVSTGAGSGDIRLDVFYPPASIYNACGQALTYNYVGGEIYTLQRTGPAVQTVGPVSPDPMHGSVSGVNVVFSATINLSTFTFQDMTLTRDGSAVVLNSTVTTSLVSGNMYRIGGLDSFTAAAGSYALTVTGSGITDSSGNAATGSASDTWNNIVAGSQVVFVNKGYTGSDPNGTLATPFKTVTTGYTGAQDGNTLRIFSGNYNETLLNMNKPLVLSATNGTVNIIGLP